MGKNSPRLHKRHFKKITAFLLSLVFCLASFGLGFTTLAANNDEFNVTLRIGTTGGGIQYLDLGNFAPGYLVEITAPTPPAGYRFSRWVVHSVAPPGVGADIVGVAFEINADYGETTDILTFNVETNQTIGEAVQSGDIAIPAVSVIKSGYVLTGWAILDAYGDIGTKFYDDEIHGHKIADDVVFVAKFASKPVMPEIFTVTFMVDSDYGYIYGEHEFKVEEGQSFLEAGHTIPSVYTTKAGHIFRGWLTDDGEEIGTEEIYNLKIDGDVVFHADIAQEPPILVSFGIFFDARGTEGVFAGEVNKHIVIREILAGESLQGQVPAVLPNDGWMHVGWQAMAGLQAVGPVLATYQVEAIVVDESTPNFVPVFEPEVNPIMHNVTFRTLYPGLGNHIIANGVEMGASYMIQVPDGEYLAEFIGGLEVAHTAPAAEDDEMPHTQTFPVSNTAWHTDNGTIYFGNVGSHRVERDVTLYVSFTLNLGRGANFAPAPTPLSQELEWEVGRGQNSPNAAFIMPEGNVILTVLWIQIDTGGGNVGDQNPPVNGDEEPPEQQEEPTENGQPPYLPESEILPPFFAPQLFESDGEENGQDEEGYDNDEDDEQGDDEDDELPYLPQQAAPLAIYDPAGNVNPQTSDGFNLLGLIASTLGLALATVTAIKAKRK